MTAPVLAQSGRTWFDPSWIGNHLDDLWQATVEHLLLTGISVTIGIVISTGAGGGGTALAMDLTDHSRSSRACSTRSPRWPRSRCCGHCSAGTTTNSRSRSWR